MRFPPSRIFLRFYSCHYIYNGQNQVDGVTFENNSAPATTWGADEAEAVADNQGSDLVMRSTGDGEVRR